MAAVYALALGVHAETGGNEIESISTKSSCFVPRSSCNDSKQQQQQVKGFQRSSSFNTRAEIGVAELRNLARRTRTMTRKTMRKMARRKTRWL